MRWCRDEASSSFARSGWYGIDGWRLFAFGRKKLSGDAWSFDPNTIRGELAKSYSISSDNKVITVTLRSVSSSLSPICGGRWSEGPEGGHATQVGSAEVREGEDPHPALRAISPADGEGMNSVSSWHMR